MLLSIRKAIQKVPLYIHIILFLAGMLNFSIPFILETNNTHDEMMYEFSSLIEKSDSENIIMNYELIETGNLQFQTNTFGIYFNQAEVGEGIQNYVLFQKDGATFYFDGSTVEQSYSEKELTKQEFLADFLEIMFQMKIVQILINILKSMLYVSFVSLVFIIAMQYLSRRYIKFMLAFKYITIPVLVGSFNMILMNNVISLSTNKLFVVSFLINSCLYGLLCSNELKRAMTGDFLGEGRVGYGVY